MTSCGYLSVIFLLSLMDRAIIWKSQKIPNGFFLNDFKYCDDNSTDIIRRFISFIDICYRDKTKIKFFFNGIAYEKLYTGKKLEILWDRCQSRLSEMQTSEYLI